MTPEMSNKSFLTIQCPNDPISKAKDRNRSVNKNVKLGFFHVGSWYNFQINICMHKSWTYSQVNDNFHAHWTFLIYLLIRSLLIYRAIYYWKKIILLLNCFLIFFFWKIIFMVEGIDDDFGEEIEYVEKIKKKKKVSFASWRISMKIK